MRAAMAAVMLVGACGSRSGLLAPAEVLGTGGSTTGGGSGAGGSGAFGGFGGGAGGASGGGGNATSQCFALELEGIASITGAQHHDELDPALLRSSDDGGQATLMFRWHTYDTEPGLVLNDKLGHLSFAAWGSWPSDLGQAWVAKTYGSGSSFALADAPGDEHAFLYYDDGSLVGPAGMYFVPAMLPKTNASSVSLGAVGQRAVFAERGASDHLLGLEGASGNGAFWLPFMRASAGPGPYHVSSGCALAPISADALHRDGGYLVALSSSRAFGTCLNDDGVNGPPTRIQLARWTDGAAQPVLVAELQLGAPVKQLALVGTASASWLVYQLASQALTEPILAHQLDASGEPSGAPLTLVPAAPVDGSFGVAALGDGLAVAWDFASGQAHIDAFDASGHWFTGLGLGVDSPAPYALLGSPSGDRLLLTWAALEPALNEKRVRVARFRCVGDMR